ncbi:MAG TPA: dienelactone hydrolase family protein [Ramlibacter sp.]|uniref:dienelactone hydrolase family protein n=1 Tax=Ramlibacter sp. TaxID=1917967 RepID=UPI002CAE3F50|nr:dienelactone hydrolase family protein [Ramlibacter sp.]HVZ45510.1 dienelactone hydrolase family protein [Ramlibacter sp.]
MRFVFFLLRQLALAAALLPCVLAAAQPVREDLLASAGRADDLVFPASPSSFGLFAAPKLALYKPDGVGPFPALVLMHQCGGLRARNGWQNRSILDWAQRGVAKGYVVLVVDSLGPRNVWSVCERAEGFVNFPRGAKDAYQAARYLAGLSYVDASRIAIAGFSWGAMVTLLTTHEAWQRTFGDSVRFAAAVAFYPGCAGSPTQTDMFLGDDIATPLLVLMGAQDNETPPSACTERLESLKSGGLPVDWHVYPNVGHCWDCENLNNFSKTVRGVQVVYRYDKATHEDSAGRLFDFLNTHMSKN